MRKEKRVDKKQENKICPVSCSIKDIRTIHHRGSLLEVGVATCKRGDRLTKPREAEELDGGRKRGWGALLE